MARQFFNAALDDELITKNPFKSKEIKVTVQGNKEREYFLTRQDADKILDACPDAQWRLIFALARYGGLRTPSETLLLRWEDVNWDTLRMIVHSPKTAHHEGRAFCVVPIFPGLYPHLLAAYEEAKQGTQYVITRYREPGLNLRTKLIRILTKAGLTPWPKLWQNLRATRQTELAKDWPGHIVCAWMGNTQAVADEHYLQVTDEDYSRAAQNATQYPTAQGGNEQKSTKDNADENADFPLVTAKCNSVHELPVGDTGLEPVTSCVSDNFSKTL